MSISIILAWLALAMKNDITLEQLQRRLKQDVYIARAIDRTPKHQARISTKRCDDLTKQNGDSRLKQPGVNLGGCYTKENSPSDKGWNQ